MSIFSEYLMIPVFYHSLLHVFFLLSIQAEYPGSVSLLNALEEFENIVIIIFPLFHLIIEILYPTACFVVSNLIPALRQWVFICGLKGLLRNSRKLSFKKERIIAGE